MMFLLQSPVLIIRDEGAFYQQSSLITNKDCVYEEPCGKTDCPTIQKQEFCHAEFISASRIFNMEEIETRVNSRSFYDSIQIKPRTGDRIVLDEQIVHLTDMLFAGLVTGRYDEDWVRCHFYFDVRGFYLLHRTSYFTEPVLMHLGGRPFRQFEQKQKAFAQVPEIGYKAFREANEEVDCTFIESVHRLTAARGTPSLLAIAGPTAAGKTEIVERLRVDFDWAGKKTTSIELDNFLTDRDYRAPFN